LHDWAQNGSALNAFLTIRKPNRC